MLVSSLVVADHLVNLRNDLATVAIALVVVLLLHTLRARIANHVVHVGLLVDLHYLSLLLLQSVRCVRGRVEAPSHVGGHRV